MQPYLVFGYGIRVNELPKEKQESLIREDGLYGFFEDYEEDTSILYLVYSSPFSDSREEKKTLTPWSTSFKEIESFKKNKKKEVSAALKEIGLENYEHLVDFHISTTEI
tara:strand:- start:927 stop:1253 length:327 start_codon:yes stop_codon:yes gene_type:complete